MSLAPPRRPSFAPAAAPFAALGLAAIGLSWATLAPPAVAQEPVVDPPAATAAEVDDGPAAAAPLPPRERKKAMTETLWYLFFVTAGALFALVAIVWGFGWYKRTFLEESPLQAELFDAAARAEIERHRKEVQAEQEAAKRAADADGSSNADGSRRETLAEQTAAPPDPAVQRDADAA